MVAKDLELIPGKLDAMQEYGLDWIPVQFKTPFTYICTLISTTDMLLGNGGGGLEHVEETHTNTVG